MEKEHNSQKMKATTFPILQTIGLHLVKNGNYIGNFQAFAVRMYSSNNQALDLFLQGTQNRLFGLVYFADPMDLLASLIHRVMVSYHQECDFLKILNRNPIKNALAFWAILEEIDDNYRHRIVAFGFHVMESLSQYKLVFENQKEYAMVYVRRP